METEYKKKIDELKGMDLTRSELSAAISQLEDEFVEDLASRDDEIGRTAKIIQSGWLLMKNARRV